MDDTVYVSRGGDKLWAALEHFGVGVEGAICCDLGSHVGGFVDCLLRWGAKRVYSIDTAYGTLAWKLRRDPRVVVMERTNAMHVTLPELMDVVTIDLGWTRQGRVLPNVAKLASPKASVVTLIKPHYEAPQELLVNGVLPDDAVDGVVANVLEEVGDIGWVVGGTMLSPIRGHGGNREVFALLRRRRASVAPVSNR
ncbi:MAG: SAM-dependent methyltransferase [Planctomycetota bacterium]|jgi:23S rRNA (cytidine1920-2'-O)/16S rRNA (cytidine1409-2'-O)-methyltransferase